MNKPKPAIDVLRRVVDYLNHSREDLNQAFDDPAELILMCQTIWATGFDLFPDQLTDDEFAMAVSGDQKGLSKALDERLG